MSTLFSFLLLFFTLHMLHVCWCVIFVVMYMNSIFLSVFSSVSSPSVWVIVPAKPWWSIETFGMIISPKDDQNGITALVILWRLARCACFSFVCFDNKSVFLLPAFSQSGFPIHWFVFAYHFYALFDSLSLNCIKWCTRCSDKTFPLISVVFPLLFE